ncbi:hypothetical protein Tco_0324294 [Tanacetum coccineum]
MSNATRSHHILKVIEKDEKWNLAAFQKDFKGLQRSFESRTRLHAKCKDGRMVHTRVLTVNGYYQWFYCRVGLAEDMDAYHDEGMGDVIFGEPFLKEFRINARQFEGMITIHNGNEEVTYQMVQSHPRFKHRTNKQCNKISPLLKDLAAKKSTKLVKYLNNEIWKVGV